VRALVIDLNNFSRYPTLPVGLLVAVLREAGVDVDVLSPLARGVRGYPRLTRAKPWGLIDSRLRYWSAVTPSRSVRALRALAARALQPGTDGDRGAIVAYAQEMLRHRPDVVLVSAYTMYEGIVRAIAKLCRSQGVPLVAGGSYLAAPEIVARWLDIDGVSAIFSGEPEPRLVDLLRDLVAGADIADYAGVSLPGRPVRQPAPPLGQLDRLPFADYADFPWERYPNRIVPIMTGRGCEWGRCRFCADVVTAAGRTFRSRTLDNVLGEIRHQSKRHDTSLFVFLDLKLNSDLELWRGLIGGLPAVAPDAAWTASVHVDTRRDHGLTRDDLVTAKRAGLARITTGLETASRRLLKSMAKGTNPERTRQFVRDAAQAGISVRLTTIIGYPGERAEDIDETAGFLMENQDSIERVMINRFSLMLGTDAERRSIERPATLPGLRRESLDPANAVVRHSNTACSTREHRRAVYRLMSTVHRINRKPLTSRAQEFEGVM
jgi:anaerobic magnesium-protoporphyrin IX monomethyl ester cyclase